MRIRFDSISMDIYFRDIMILIWYPWSYEWSWGWYPGYKHIDTPIITIFW